MMPVEWQHAFISNCQDIASPNYTLLNQQQYMGTQEMLRHALTQTCCSHHNQSHNQIQHEHSPNNNHHWHDKTTMDHIINASTQTITTMETCDSSNIILITIILRTATKKL